MIADMKSGQPRIGPMLPRRARDVAIDDGAAEPQGAHDGSKQIVAAGSRRLVEARRVVFFQR